MRHVHGVEGGWVKKGLLGPVILGSAQAALL